MKEIAFPQFTVQAPGHWFDVTAELDGDAQHAPPPTIAVEDGHGALQVSIEQLPGGKQVQFNTEQLRGMLKEFAQGHQLDSPNNIAAVETPRPQLAANFAWDGGFLRVWYLTEPDRLAFVTYTCEKGVPFATELQEVEEIVRSLRFK